MQQSIKRISEGIGRMEDCLSVNSLILVHLVLSITLAMILCWRNRDTHLWRLKRFTSSEVYKSCSCSCLYRVIRQGKITFVLLQLVWLLAFCIFFCFVRGNIIIFDNFLEVISVTKYKIVFIQC